MEVPDTPESPADLCDVCQVHLPEEGEDVDQDLVGEALYVGGACISGREKGYDKGRKGLMQEMSLGYKEQKVIQMEVESCKDRKMKSETIELHEDQEVRNDFL